MLISVIRPLVAAATDNEESDKKYPDKVVVKDTAKAVVCHHSYPPLK